MPLSEPALHMPALFRASGNVYADSSQVTRRNVGRPPDLQSLTFVQSHLFFSLMQLNNCCGHFSPLKEDSVDLKEGDVAKM